jgi:hypothetical protein
MLWFAASWLRSKRIVGIFGVDTLFDTILRIVCKNHSGWPDLLETEIESV